MIAILLGLDGAERQLEIYEPLPWILYAIADVGPMVYGSMPPLDETVPVRHFYLEFQARGVALYREH